MRGSGRTAALVLVVSLLAAACSPPPATTEQPDPDGAIATPVQDLPALIDPLFTGNLEQARHTSMLFEGLMTFDPTSLAPIPAAARDQPKVSADGFTYTFTLRDGSKYSDGSPLRAKDFAYAFSRICAPAQRAAPALARLIAGCEALRRLDPSVASATEIAAGEAGLGLKAHGDVEITVTLTEPVGYFTALTALPMFFPVRETDVSSAAGAYGTPSAIASLIGNGPFKLVEWTPDQRMVFERNDHYRSPAKLKRWSKPVVPLDVALAAYKNDEIDFFGGAPYRRVASVRENLVAIEADPQMRSEIVNAGPAALTDVFILNVSRPPFTDRSVRQAFAKAIDRDGATFRELLQFSAPARSLIPPGRPGHDPEDTFQSFDAARAHELLRSSSFAGAPELSSIKVVYPMAPTKTPAEIFQQQLKVNLGVEIGLELVDQDTFNALFADPRTVPQITYTRLGELFSDPHAWFGAVRSGSSFAAPVGYRNAELDALIDAAKIERDATRRADIYRRASRLLSEDAFMIWFIWPSNIYLRKARVKGVTDTPRDYEYGLSRITDIYVVKGP